MKGSSKRKLDQQVFLEQVHECRDKGYLLSSKIGSSAFSKVYLAYTTHERIMHNCKLASDPGGQGSQRLTTPSSRTPEHISAWDRRGMSVLSPRCCFPSLTPQVHPCAQRTQDLSCHSLCPRGCGLHQWLLPIPTGGYQDCLHCRGPCGALPQVPAP